MPQSHGTSVPQSHDTSVPQSHGRSVPQSHGKSVPQSHGTSVSQSHGTSVSQSHGTSVPQSHGKSVPQSHGRSVVTVLLSIGALEPLRYYSAVPVYPISGPLSMAPLYDGVRVCHCTTISVPWSMAPLYVYATVPLLVCLDPCHPPLYVYATVPLLVNHGPRNPCTCMPLSKSVYYTPVALVIQLTRSELIATVKDVCWEIIYFVLSYYHSK